MTILQPSCDALDLAPEDYYGAGNFWKEASQPKAFMLGLHAQLRSYYDMFYTLGELRGGTQRVGTSSLNTSLKKIKFLILIHNFLGQTIAVQRFPFQ
jgi:hypothetical protein